MTPAKRFPSERSSRRPGWTEGPALTLADGQPWHLPKVDDSIAPLLSRLMPSAETLNDELFSRIYLDWPAAPGMGDRILEFLRLAMETQYDCPPDDIQALVEGYPEANGIALMEALDHFLHDLTMFATHRVPYVAGVDNRPWQATN